MDAELRTILERIEGRVERTEHQLVQIDERLPEGLEPINVVLGDRTIVLEQHGGIAVWVDAEADAHREASTLCHRCALFVPKDSKKNCGIAEGMKVLCDNADIAVTLTRCKHFMFPEQREHVHKPDTPPDDLEHGPPPDVWTSEVGGHA